MILLDYKLNVVSGEVVSLENCNGHVVSVAAPTALVIRAIEQSANLTEAKRAFEAVNKQAVDGNEFTEAAIELTRFLRGQSNTLPHHLTVSLPADRVDPASRGLAERRM